MDAEQISLILTAALKAGLLAAGGVLFTGLWQLLKNALSRRTVEVLDQIVFPVVQTTVMDPDVREKFQAMFRPDSPGGRWPTEAEIRDLAKVVEQRVRPQLGRLRGFALKYAEEEILASVRRFFARLGVSQPTTPCLPAAGQPASIGPDDPAV